MALVKFQRRVTRSSEVKVNKNNITITDAGLRKLAEVYPELSSATAVNLWWDNEPGNHSITIAPTSADDSDAVPAKQGQGNRRGLIISAKDFLNSEIINVPKPITNYEPHLTRNETGVAFKVIGPAPAGNGTAPKRRGRRPKNYQPPA